MSAVRTMKPRDKAIRIRLTGSDKEQLQQAAAELGVSVAAFIRTAALASASQVQTECKQGD